MRTETRKCETFKYTMRIDWFDSPAEFAERANAEIPAGSQDCDKRWTGETWHEASTYARTGRLTHVAAAEKLLQQIESHVEAPKAEWINDRFGAFPNVPAFLQGQQECMRRRVQAPNDRAPIRIFVDLVSSAGIDHEILAKRGVAYLALAMALTNERPVELFALIPLGNHESGTIVAVKIPSQPLDLAVACNALTSTGMIRGLGYSWCQTQRAPGAGGYYDWAFGEYPQGEQGRARYIARMRDCLQASPSDVITAPAFLNDEAVTDPVAFVQRSLAEYAAHSEEW